MNRTLLTSRAPQRRALLCATLALALGAPATAQHHDEHDERALQEDPRLAPGQIAPVLEGLGDHHREVTTLSEQAQLFFDQGLKLTYGFNHQEALRAFKEAARLDPDCAMAYWGWALVLGPNLNLPMAAEVVPQAWEAIRTAVRLKDKVSEKERGLIDALAQRFTDDPAADRAPFDRAYAGAMEKLYAKYPDDNDIATLYAAALMNLAPWNYWTRDGEPRADTPKLLAALEGVIERDPHHEGALHYYIHAVESVDPDRGEKAADLLRGLTPGAGHLVHMPSHIYMQLGRYAEAVQANADASRADEGYITQCRAQGLYPLTYYPHNVHFLAWAAALQGKSRLALEEARKVADKVPADHQHNVWQLYETFLGMPLYVMVRFGMWDEILKEPQPPEEARLLAGLWHYARGLALLNTRGPREASAELKTLDRYLADPSLAQAGVGFSSAERLLTIARQILRGEIKARQGEYDEAIAHLDRAIRLEDANLYNEPPDWFQPVRHNLGAVLLEAGRPVEAEVVYWQDLKKYRNNGFALYGLWQALKAQGRTAEAADIEARFRKSWADADVQLASSRF
jgi:tetratricopeptide (TPR) repeat protein